MGHELYDRSRRMRRARAGIGQFRELADDPQDPSRVLAENLKDSLGGQPGLRLAQATGRRLFTAAGLAPQRFVRPPSETNEADQIRAAMIHRNAPRHVGKSRGRPG